MQPHSKHGVKQLAIASVYSLFLQGMVGGLVTGIWVAPIQAAELIAWQFNPENTELELTVPPGVTPRYFILAEPARIVVDLPNTELGTVMAEQAYSGQVRQIRVNQFEPGLTRIVLELSPNAEFADGQVELQRMAESAQGDRWVVRPLLVNAVSPIASTPPSPTIPTSQPSVAPIAPVESPRLEAAPPTPTPSTAIAATPITPPPLEPGALEIPVQPAPVESTPSAPPATPEPPEDGPPVAIDPVPTATIPLAIPSPDEIESEVTSAPIEVASPIALVEFGQPLPNVAAITSPQADPVPNSVVASTRDRLIPAGTVLPLRYSGTAPLQLQVNIPWQEVLLLDQPVLDRNGTLIAPAGSPVIGQFELTEDGSVFTARAIVLEGRNVRLDAATDTIEPRSNLIQPNQVIEAQLFDTARLSE